MKKLFIPVFLLFLFFSLSACKSPQEMIGDAIGKAITKGITGADIDTDNGSISIKGESGEELSFGSDKWPDNNLSKKIPKFAAGKIDTSYISEEAIVVIINEVKKSDFDNYVEKVKQTGFDVDEQSVEMSTDFVYYASNSENYYLALTYSSEDSLLTISLNKGE